MEKFIYRKSAGVTALSVSMKDFTYKKHAHREYALGVTLRGIQQYNLDGHNQLSYPNGVMLFNPEQPHDGMAYDDDGLDYVMLYIEPELMLEMTEQKEVFLFSNPIVYNGELERKIVNLSTAVLNQRDEALCYELLVSLIDSLTLIEMKTSYRKADPFVSKAKEMMHASLHSVLKLDEICKELQLSKFKFIRLFKQHTGISPYQYFLNGKVELAKHILEKSRDVYMAVAACGFVDLAHMNRHFKHSYGITAYEYMQFFKW
ncbi:AraC family transcriptional regulator [Terribacillus halophilus]|jgi:AraC-like DNA-binding protein|uniref:AraC family transcriptional regulator n=1 Tax=Terribacillus halophilus TaxID=361279 RepID=UPI00098437BB|nr:AraC family transcriptional regulator [Terribacillus halophilus]